jgi:hypothetical protein
MSVRWKWVGLWAVVVAAEIAALAGILQAEEPVPGYRVVFRLIGGVFCAHAACRLAPAAGQPQRLLMLATGFGLLVEPVFAPLDPGVLKTIGDLLEDAWGIPLIALLLTFLTGGRLESRIDRLLVGPVRLATALEFVRHLFLPRDGNFLLVNSNPDLADALLAAEELCVAVGCLAVAGVIGTRWARASPPRRRRCCRASRASWPCCCSRSRRGRLAGWRGSRSARCWRSRRRPRGPAAVAAGAWRPHRARSGDLRTMQGPALQATLARTLGDPSLVLATGCPVGSVCRRERRARRLPKPARPIGRADRARGREVAASSTTRCSTTTPS